MSQVSHDATSIRHHGIRYRKYDDTAKKKENIGDPLKKKKNFGNGFEKRKVADKYLRQRETYGDVDANTCYAVTNQGNIDLNNKNFNESCTLQKSTILPNSFEKSSVETLQKRLLIKAAKQNEKFNSQLHTVDIADGMNISYENKSWRPLEDIFMKRTNISYGTQTCRVCKKWPLWSLNSAILVSLMVLSVAGEGNAVETSSFSAALTSRMIASFLGYPTTCTLGAEVRPCTLSFTCWLRGGTRLRGCGGWLFSCCGPPEPSQEVFDNSIASSDWKYKVSPPRLRQVPQRNVLSNNVFRRRVDDDLSQMECGLPASRILQKRIIGGREAQFAEFPWQAHVRISEFQCGGVLVSRWFVATAAHCVSRAHTREIAVWLGAVDTSATHHPARKIGVVQKILHPLFQFRMTQPDRYDIALLRLSRPITYMNHILPICLPDYDLDLRGRSGVIAGWGKTDTSNGHTGTNLLRSATVPILSKEQCINWHQIKQISVEIHSEMICAGHSDGHQDACLGDSGGPLIVLDNGRYYLVGITSAGFGCGVDHQPGIYHNVKVTANWIRGVISPSINYFDI